MQPSEIVATSYFGSIPSFYAIAKWVLSNPHYLSFIPLNDSWKKKKNVFLFSKWHTLQNKWLWHLNSSVSSSSNFRLDILNPTIFNIIRCVTGLLGYKRLMDQASDVSSIIFFIIFCKILCKNRFNLFSYLL